MQLTKEELEKILDLITTEDEIEDEILKNVAIKIKLHLIYMDKQEEFLKFMEEYKQKLTELEK